MFIIKNLLKQTLIGNFPENPVNSGVRPLVYLKSDLQTSGKDANGAWIIK